MAGKLVPLEGPLRQAIDVPDGAQIRLGRALDNQIVVQDVLVSRLHCVFQHTPEGVVVQDNKSSNGTLVNGERVQSRLLRHGDEIRAGSVRLRFVQETLPGRSPGGPARPAPAAPAPQPAQPAVCSRCGKPVAGAAAAERVLCPQCSGKLGLVGQTLAGYAIVDWLGQGAIGTVYKARQVSLERFVALKVLHPNLTTQEIAVKRFLREARTGARLRHPNIVSLYDQGRIGNCYYIAMEYVEGVTLSDIVTAGGPFQQGQAAAVFGPICDAVSYAHEAGIVHRDIKPANIMLTADGTPKLTDMGLAKGLEDSLTLAGMVVGTPGYISPEQVLDLDVIDHRVDVFGLGASLYFTVTGLPPFVGKTPTEIMKKSATEDPPDPRQFNPSLTAEFELVIRTALAKKAEERYETALAMAKALARFA